MIRKTIRVLLLIPLALILVALAVANRQAVTISLDPFDHVDPALAVALPLYALILLLLIVGVIVGGIAAWLGQSEWRRRARRAEGEARVLRAESQRLRQGDSVVPSAAPPAAGRGAGQAAGRGIGETSRLSIPPPAV